MELERGECVRLLAAHTFGRAGLTVGALPTVLAVRYVFVDGQIFFRTSVSPKLAAATSGAVIAFEIDHLDATDHTGWSVVAIGLAQHITDAVIVAKLDSIGLGQWTPKEPDVVVGVSIDLVSGCRA